MRANRFASGGDVATHEHKKKWGSTQGIRDEVFSSAATVQCGVPMRWLLCVSIKGGDPTFIV